MKGAIALAAALLVVGPPRRTTALPTTRPDGSEFLTDNNQAYFDPSGPGHWSQPGGASFDCAMRKLAYEFGKQLRPDQGAFSSLHEALDLNGFAGPCKTEAAAPTEAELSTKQDFGVVRASTEMPTHALFVAPDGNDAATGTRVAPLQSIQLACDRAAKSAALTADQKPHVVLRAGSHYLPETLLLGPQHSGLTLMAHPGEKAVVSGGKELKVAWKKAGNPNRADLDDAAANIYVADISGQVEDVPGLQVRVQGPGGGGGVKEERSRRGRGRGEGGSSSQGLVAWSL
jgi:hypothetical protein